MGYNTKETVKKKEAYVNKNFLLVNLEETKAKKIAEVINNDTSRKIIDSLAKNDATESELSKSLKIPISTIHYNLKQLQDAGLVIVEEFHYSTKGKEVNHYTLANKYIIIAPKSDNSNFLEALKKIMPIAIISAAVAFVMQLYNNTSTYSMQKTAQGAALRTMAFDSTAATEAARPAIATNPVAYFLVGALAVLIIYFVYEFVRKK